MFCVHEQYSTGGWKWKRGGAGTPTRLAMLAALNIRSPLPPNPAKGRQPLCYLSPRQGAPLFFPRRQPPSALPFLSRVAVFYLVYNNKTCLLEAIHPWEKWECRGRLPSREEKRGT